MKLRFSVVAVLFLGILIMCSGLAYAEELSDSVGSLNALNSGYAITRWPWDGGEIFVGEDATVRACTTEPPYPEATHVVFRWIRPDGSELPASDPKPLTYSGDTWNGKDIYDAYDTQTIDMLSTPTENWGVQALFCGPDGKTLPISPAPTVAIRAISWHAVPEVPVGTIATVLCIFGALGVFAIKKRGSVSSLKIRF